MNFSKQTATSLFLCVLCYGLLMESSTWAFQSIPAFRNETKNASPQRVTRSFTEPIAQSIVACKQAGVIANTRVREGDLVTEGQPLASISHDVLLVSKKIALSRAKSTAAVDSAQSRLDIVVQQKQTLLSLMNTPHVNKLELQQKSKEVDSAIAELSKAKTELELAELEVVKIEAQIEDCTIRAPIGGFVTEIHRQVGEHIAPNRPEYATISQVDKLKVRFYLGQNELKQLTRDTNVVLLLGKESKSVVGSVMFVSPIIDPQSGTGRVDIAINNPDLKILSGTVCNWGQIVSKRTAKKLQEFPTRSSR